MDLDEPRSTPAAAPPGAGRGVHDQPPPRSDAADPTVHRDGATAPAHSPADAAELHGPRPTAVHRGATHQAAGDEDHDAHAEPPLGAIDLQAWAASLLGIAIAGVVAFFFFLAIT